MTDTYTVININFTRNGQGNSKRRLSCEILTLTKDDDSHDEIADSSFVVGNRIFTKSNAYLLLLMRQLLTSVED